MLYDVILLFWNIILSLACIQPCQVLGRLGTHLVGSTELVVQVVAGASPVDLLTSLRCLAFGTLVGCGWPGSPGSISVCSWLLMRDCGFPPSFSSTFDDTDTRSHTGTHTPQEDCLFMYLCIFVCRVQWSLFVALPLFLNTYCRIVFPRLQYIAVHVSRHVHFKYQQTYCDRSN